MSRRFALLCIIALAAIAFLFKSCSITNIDESKYAHLPYYYRIQYDEEGLSKEFIQTNPPSLSGPSYAQPRFTSYKKGDNGIIESVNAQLMFDWLLFQSNRFFSLKENITVSPTPFIQIKCVSDTSFFIEFKQYECLVCLLDNQWYNGSMQFIRSSNDSSAFSVLFNISKAEKICSASCYQNCRVDVSNKLIDLLCDDSFPKIGDTKKVFKKDYIR